MKKFASAALLAACAAAHADGAKLLTPVSYASDSAVVPKVREETLINLVATRP